MRVLIWPAGDENDGTSQYRLYLPANVLRSEGLDIEVDTTGPSVLWNKDWRGWPSPPADAQALALAAKPDADVVVMQRPGRRWWADIIPMLQALGIRVVVDIDDHFARIDKDNAAWKPFNTDSTAHHHTWVAEACKRADVVTVSTPTLADFYGFGHGRVLPNMVPERYLKVGVDRLVDTVAWTGTIRSHPHDLQVTRGGVADALQETGWHFHVVGNSEGVSEALSLASEPTATGWVPFDHYPAAMAAATVGIVPLADTVFNNSKSCLKMLEFASLGVPPVVTATQDNLRLYKMGIGNIVKNPAQWRRGMLRLIGNQGYREEVAGRSREKAAELTYEKHAWRWAEAWGLK